MFILASKVSNGLAPVHTELPFLDCSRTTSNNSEVCKKLIMEQIRFQTPLLNGS